MYVLSLSFEFQFLIGTLKTGIVSLISAPLSVFQFLIGTLKTEMGQRLGLSR